MILVSPGVCLLPGSPIHVLVLANHFVYGHQASQDQATNAAISSASRTG
jgi:hypothetical protein